MMSLKMILVCAVLAILALNSEAKSMMGFNNGQQQLMQQQLPYNIQTMYEQQYPKHNQQQQYGQYQTTTPLYQQQQYGQYQTTTPLYQQQQYGQYQPTTPLYHQYLATSPQYQPSTSYNDQDRQQYKYYVYDQIRKMIQSKFDLVDKAPQSAEPVTPMTIEEVKPENTDSQLLDKENQFDDSTEQTKRSEPLTMPSQLNKTEAIQTKSLSKKEMKKIQFNDNMKQLQAKNPFQKPLYMEYFNKDGTSQVIQLPVETTEVPSEVEVPKNSLETVQEPQEPQEQPAAPIEEPLGPQVEYKKQQYQQAQYTQEQKPEPLPKYPPPQYSNSVNRQPAASIEKPLGPFGMPIPPAGLLGPPPPPHLTLPNQWLFPRAAIVPYQGNFKGPRRDRYNHHYSQNSKYLSAVNNMRG